MDKPSGKGIIFVLSAYLLWGFLPPFWKILIAVNSLHILSCRIIFSLIIVAVVLFTRKSFSWLAFYKDPHKALLLAIAAFTVTFNWGLYIWCVNTGHTLQASLGYYINPLFSIMFGQIFFREKLSFLQWVAFCLAIAGVVTQTVISGSLPWVSIGMALSFSIYGLLKKKISMPALESLGIECLIVTPIAMLLLFAPFVSVLLPTWQSVGYMADLPAITFFFLVLSGAITMVPLYLFGRGAQLVPLSTLGFFQFISPTMNFLFAFFVFGEPFPWYNYIVFGLIWSAMILYIISLNIATRERTDQ